MGLYSRAKEIDHRISDSDIAYRIKEILDTMLPVVVVALFIVLYLEFFGHLSHANHAKLLIAEKLILAYFIAELLVDLGIYRSNKKFFKERWLDILLVLPFFTAFKALRGFKGLKAVKPVKTAKGAKAPKAAKATKLVRAKHIGKEAKKMQHTTKAVKKGKEIAEELLPSFKDRLV